MSMTPTAIPSPPVGRAANEKTIEGRTRATTTVKSLAASVSELSFEFTDGKLDHDATFDVGRL